MNIAPHPSDSRGVIWQKSARIAFVFAAVLLILIRVFTRMPFGAVLPIALLVFAFSFAFILRLVGRPMTD